MAKKDEHHYVMYHKGPNQYERRLSLIEEDMVRKRNKAKKEFKISFLNFLFWLIISVGLYITFS